MNGVNRLLGMYSIYCIGCGDGWMEGRQHGRLEGDAE